MTSTTPMILDRVRFVPPKGSSSSSSRINNKSHNKSKSSKHSSSKCPTTKAFGKKKTEEEDDHREDPRHGGSSTAEDKTRSTTAPRSSNPSFEWRMILWTLLYHFSTVLQVMGFLVRLLSGSIVMLPGYLRWLWFYFCVVNNNKSCSTIRRTCVRYGDSIRQSMDIFYTTTPTTTKTDNVRPVIVFCPGGAWMIGYKFWGVWLARNLLRMVTATLDHGLVVILLDHRNYPLATVPEQVQDVQTALSWIRTHIAHCPAHGNPKQILTVGESAGGHLLWMALYASWFQTTTTTTTKNKNDNSKSRARAAGKTSADESDDESDTTLTSLSSSSSSSPQPPSFRNGGHHVDTTTAASCDGILGLITVATPLDVREMLQPFTARAGLHPHFVQDYLFDSHMEQYNPMHIVQKYNDNNSHDNNKKPSRQPSSRRQSLPPPLLMIHGTRDEIVPIHQGPQFARALQQTGLFRPPAAHVDADSSTGKSSTTVQAVSWKGASHTHATIQGPMAGDDFFYHLIFNSLDTWIHESDNHNVRADKKDETASLAADTCASLPKNQEEPPRDCVAGDGDVVADGGQDETIESRRDEHQSTVVVVGTPTPAGTAICPEMLIRIGTWIMPI